MNAKIECVDHKISLIGELSFSTVQKLLDQCRELTFPISGQIVIDFAQVTKVDSSAIALCLALEKRLATDSALVYSDIPVALLAISQSVGVGSLFISNQLGEA